MLSSICVQRPPGQNPKLLFPILTNLKKSQFHGDVEVGLCLSLEAKKCICIFSIKKRTETT